MAEGGKNTQSDQKLLEMGKKNNDLINLGLTLFKFVKTDSEGMRCYFPNGVLCDEAERRFYILSLLTCRTFTSG